MTTLVIKDLEENRELDKQAMARVMGGYYDPISWYINSVAAAFAIWSPGTWPLAQQIGQQQAQPWINRLAFSGSAPSLAGRLGVYSDIVSWARSPIIVNGQRIF